MAAVWTDYANDAIRELYPKARRGVDYFWGRATPGAPQSMLKDDYGMDQAAIQAVAELRCQLDPNANYLAKPIAVLSGFTPVTVRASRAGVASGATITTLVAVGGSAPFTWTMVSAAGLAIAITAGTGVLRCTTAPIGAVNATTAYRPEFKVADGRGFSITKKLDLWVDA